jgi:hypothetical protein
MRIDSSGRVGIGTTSPTQPLDVVGGFIKNDTGTLLPTARFTGVSGGAYISTNATDNPITLVTGTGNAERARIDSSGRLLVGTSTSTSIAGAEALTQINAGSGTGLSIFRQNSTPILTFGISGGSGATLVSGSAVLGEIRFAGADGTDLNTQGAKIAAEVDGTPGANDMPGRLVFSTTSDSASSPTERLRITSDAYVRLASGTAGIQFNGDTAAANALDDYEEGTWTPSITGSTTAGTIGYDSQVGKYTKIGNIVTVSCVADTGIVTAAPTGDLRVSGLPFNAVSFFEFVGAVVIKGIPFPASTTTVSVSSVASQSYVHFFASGDNAVAARVQADSLATDDYVRFTLTYRV